MIWTQAEISPDPPQPKHHKKSWESTVLNEKNKSWNFCGWILPKILKIFKKSSFSTDSYWISLALSWAGLQKHCESQWKPVENEDFLKTFKMFGEIHPQKNQDFVFSLRTVDSQLFLWCLGWKGSTVWFQLASRSLARGASIESKNYRAALQL